MSYRLPLKVNCVDHDGTHCVAGHWGGTPCGRTCEHCPHRRERDHGPAVEWIEGVEVCLAKRLEWPAAWWMRFEDERLALVGAKIIVPVALYQAARRAFPAEN